MGVVKVYVRKTCEEMIRTDIRTVVASVWNTWLQTKEERIMGSESVTGGTHHIFIFLTY